MSSCVVKWCRNHTDMKNFEISFHKLFWTVAIASMLMSACWLSQLLYGRYMDSPTRVSIEGFTEHIETMPFPSITICSPNQVSMSFMKHFNRTLVDGDINIDLQEMLPKLLSFYYLTPRDTNFTSDMEAFQTILDKNRYMVTEVMGGMGQTCENFLKQCEFEGKPYPSCKTLFYPVLTPSGLCCTFNNRYYFKDIRNRPNPDFRNLTPKFDNMRIDKALRVTADIDIDDALGNSLLYGGAVKIMFSNSDEFPYNKQTIFLDTNTESFHTIRPTLTICADEMKVLQPHVRKCYFEDEKSLEYFHQYRVLDCEFECFLNAVEEKCGCLMFYAPKGFAKNFCNLTNINCASELNYNAMDLNLNECDCRQNCEFRSYNIDTLLGNMDAVPHLLHPESWPYGINKSSLKLTFSFFRPLYLKKKQETIMPFSSFISNLGGVFGLCLGCSCISVAEILFCLYIAIYKRKRPQRKVKHKRAMRSIQLPYME